jgi:hypothetical protein
LAMVIASCLCLASSCVGGASGGSDPPRISIAVVPDPAPIGKVGEPYEVVLHSNFTWEFSSYEWNITGQIPPGLTFCDGDKGYQGTICKIAGTPAVAGVFRMNVSVNRFFGGRLRETSILSGGLTITVSAP